MTSNNFLLLLLVLVLLSLYEIKAWSPQSVWENTHVSYANSGLFINKCGKSIYYCLYNACLTQIGGFCTKDGDCGCWCNDYGKVLDKFIVCDRADTELKKEKYSNELVQRVVPKLWRNPNCYYDKGTVYMLINLAMKSKDEMDVMDLLFKAQNSYLSAGAIKFKFKMTKNNGRRFCFIFNDGPCDNTSPRPTNLWLFPGVAYPFAASITGCPDADIAFTMTKSCGDQRNIRTVCHETGHIILGEAYGEDISRTHKGSSGGGIVGYWDQSPSSNAPTPATSNDIMHYYQGNMEPAAVAFRLADLYAYAATCQIGYPPSDL